MRSFKEEKSLKMNEKANQKKMLGFMKWAVQNWPCLGFHLGTKRDFCCKREDCIFILIVFKITLGPRHNTKARHKLFHSAHSAFDIFATPSSMRTVNYWETIFPFSTNYGFLFSTIWGQNVNCPQSGTEWNLSSVGTIRKIKIKPRNKYQPSLL